MLINPIFCIPIYMLYTAEKVKAVFYSKHRGVFRSFSQTPTKLNLRNS